MREDPPSGARTLIDFYLPIVSPYRLFVETSIHAHQSGGEGGKMGDMQLLVCIKGFWRFVLVAWYFFAEWILYTRSTAWRLTLQVFEFAFVLISLDITYNSPEKFEINRYFSYSSNAYRITHNSIIYDYSAISVRINLEIQFEAQGKNLWCSRNGQCEKSLKAGFRVSLDSIELLDDY